MIFKAITGSFGHALGGKGKCGISSIPICRIDRKQTGPTDKLNLALLTYEAVVFFPIQHMLQVMTSCEKLGLFPRPFPPSVFDHLQDAKSGEGRPGRKSRVHDVRYTWGSGSTWGGRCLTKESGGSSCNILSKNSRLFERQLQYRLFGSLRLEAYQRKVCELQWSDTAPPMSTIMSTWRHAHGSFSQAFPLQFWILQAIKN